MSFGALLFENFRNNFYQFPSNLCNPAAISLVYATLVPQTMPAMAAIQRYTYWNCCYVLVKIKQANKLFSFINEILFPFTIDMLPRR